MIVKNARWVCLCVFVLMFYACADSEPGAGGAPCSDTGECAAGLVCDEGVCIDVSKSEGTRGGDGGTPRAEDDLADYTEACESDADCKSDFACINTPAGDSICTRRCPPDGGNASCNEVDLELEMECLGIRPDAGDLVHVCVPRPQTQCQLCERDGDDITGECGTVGLDLCRQQDDGDFRCSIACADDLPCPEGDACTAVPASDGTTYEVCVPITGYCKKCVDIDEDGYGDPAYDMSDCDVPNVADCDDQNGDVFPGKPTMCNGLDDACEGRVDDEYRNADGQYNTLPHCGDCNQPCALEHAVAECGTGVCTFVECEPGWVNLDGNESVSGCPYECTPRTDKSEDRPDDLTDPAYGDELRDYNCDGIDGDIERAYFVAKTGNNNNPGTPDRPFKTIGHALDLLDSMSTTIGQIYVSHGEYSENLMLVDGVSIYGGFDAAANWERKLQHHVIIAGRHNVDGNRIGLRGEDLDGPAPTVIQNLKITAVDATGRITGSKHGAGSYGFHCVNCPALEVRGVTITAGTGADGVKGANGLTASTTRPASCHGDDGLMMGGGEPNYEQTRAGSGFQCNSADPLVNLISTKRGGTGGASPPNVGDDGVKGQNSGARTGGSGGAGIGTGQCGGLPYETAEDGGDGAAGASGGNGSGGRHPTGLSSSGFYVPRNGSFNGLGMPGEPGAGGGGGGGGGTHTATLPKRRHSGGPGGGGGAGGCPGGGAHAGGGGGPSVAVALANSTGVVLERLTLTASNAGNGASGGSGGQGRQGCVGGDGSGGGSAAQCNRAGGIGGDGGDGGRGGRGGNGGGGAGGSAIGLLLGGTSTSLEDGIDVTLPVEAGSPAGTSNSRGASGLLEARHSM